MTATPVQLDIIVWHT